MKYYKSIKKRVVHFAFFGDGPRSGITQEAGIESVNLRKFSGALWRGARLQAIGPIG